MLLTLLLVLAIVASTVLVFTNRVELLKLAVVLALWAAVAAAFVSFIYRRQSDLDQAKARDLKYVYDLQLDREISARREYELAVEAQLRRELAAELRAQSADEVAALRAELAALRTNLEILFDTDLDQRPALENERPPAGRVIASRIDTPPQGSGGARVRPEAEPRTEESAIIDVPAEPHPPEFEWVPTEATGGAHRRASETEQPAPWRPPAAPRSESWTPAPAQGQWIPAGTPGSNWVPPDLPRPAPPVAPVPAAGPPPSVPPVAPPPPPAPAAAPPPVAPAPEPPAARPGQHAPVTPVTGEDRRGRHSSAEAEEAPRRARHSVPGEAGPPVPLPPSAAPAARHRSAQESPEPAEPEDGGGQHAGGQPVSELLSRLQAAPTGGGRRRRREE